MSDVWPPSPKNQPERAASAVSGSKRLAAIVSSGLFYSCLGTLLLLTPVIVVVSRNFAVFRWLDDFPAILGGLVLFSLILMIVGGWLGHTVRRTANGFAAFVVSVAVLTALAGFIGFVVIRNL